MKMLLYLVIFHPQTLTHNHEGKKMIQIPVKRNPTILTNILQNCQGHPKQRKSEKLSQPRGA